MKRATKQVMTFGNEFYGPGIVRHLPSVKTQNTESGLIEPLMEQEKFESPIGVCTQVDAVKSTLMSPGL